MTLILVVSVDPTQDLTTQLRDISESSKIPLIDVFGAWNNRHGPHITVSNHGLASTIEFEIKTKFEEKELRETHSYKAVKERNKFFNRRR